MFYNWCVITRKQVRERFKKLAIKSDKRLSTLRDQIDHKIKAGYAKNKFVNSRTSVLRRKKYNHEMIKMIRDHTKKWDKDLLEILIQKVPW